MLLLRPLLLLLISSPGCCSSPSPSSSPSLSSRENFAPLNPPGAPLLHHPSRLLDDDHCRLTVVRYVLRHGAHEELGDRALGGPGGLREGTGSGGKRNEVERVEVRVV